MTRALTTLFLLTTAGLAHAETAEEIIEKARDARSVENSVQNLEMAIVGKNGSERVRELEIKVKLDGDIWDSQLYMKKTEAFCVSKEKYKKDLLPGR